MHHQTLIIDDSMPLHQLVKAHLEDEGLEFHSAYDGDTGLELATKIRPSIILLDVDMPNMDGFEVCRRLKGNKETAAIPVIFLTADFNTEDKVRGLDAGAVDYVTKPFKVDELRARVRASLRTQHQIEQRAMIDGLTGLWNRAYLEDHISAQLSQANRTGQPLSCIVADVDELSRINERHGRSFGDEVLRSVSQLLLSQCRAEDAVCSCGDGKFAVLLSGMDRRAASRLADRLCAETQRQLAVKRGIEVGVTCSFGVADSCIAGDTSLLDRADAAMRRAKQNGRSCVSIARPNRQHAAAAA